MLNHEAREVLTTIDIRALRPILDAARALGVDVAECAELAHVERGAIASGEGRIPRAAAHALLFEVSVRAGSERVLALEAVKRIKVGDFGVLGYLAGTAPTLRDAARVLVQYFALLHDTASLMLDERDRLARFGFVGAPARDVPPVLIEFALAAFTACARRASGIYFRGLEVRCAHPSTGHDAAYQEFFGARIRYGQTATEITFPRVFLDLQVNGADSALHATLRQCAGKLVEQMPRGTTFVDRVRRALLDQIAKGDVSIDTLARTCGFPARTLQRRLEESGTSHRTLLGEVRAELALLYVAGDELPIGHIASTLGFKDASAFCRAFRRWTGSTPREYRNTFPRSSSTMRAGRAA